MQDQMPAQGEQAAQEPPSMEQLIQGFGEGLQLLGARMQADGAPPEQIEQVMAAFDTALKSIQGGGQPEQVGPTDMETGGMPAKQVL